MSKVQEILNQITAIGPVLPGTLEKQYNVCGKSGCRCKDPENPQKHGPYFRLSYSLNGKNSSMFVKKEDAEAVAPMTQNYKRLRTLSMELALASIEEVKKSGISTIMEQQSPCCNATDSEAKKPVSHESFRKKANELRAAQVKINDLTSSRDMWKHKCVNLKKENCALQHELAVITKENESVKREKKS
jgi:hypothetical protein